MNNKDLFNYLVATDSLDEFLGYELPSKLKEELDNLVADYKKERITDDEIQDVLMGIEKMYNINYEILYNYFKEQLD